MRAKKNHLHELISTFDKREVKHIRSVLESKYNTKARPLLKLFDQIRKLEEYDEEKLISKLLGKRKKQHFHRWKSDLYDVVLELLVEVNKKDNARAHLYEMLERAEILRKKRLPEQSFIMLEKAEMIAKKFEFHIYELEINRMRRTILSETYPKNPLQAIQQQISRKNATLLKLSNEFQYRDVSTQIFTMLRQYHSVQDKQLIKEMAALMEQDFMKNEKQALSVNARISFHYAHYRYQKMLENYELANYHIRQVVELWNLHPHRKEEYPLYYRQTIVNLCSSYYRLREFDQIESLIEEAKKFTGKSNTEKASYFQEIALMEFLLYMNTGQLDKALEFAHRSEKDLDKYSHLIQNSHRIAMISNIATIYFLTDQPRQALKTLNGIITEKCDERKDIQEYSLIFQLILLHMAGKYDVLESQLRSSSRSIRSGSNFKTLEGFIVTQLKGLLKLNKPDYPAFFEKFLAEITQLKEEGKISNTGFEEICLWATAHKEKKSMQEVFLASLEKSKP